MPRLSQLREYMLAQRVPAVFHAHPCTPSAFLREESGMSALGVSLKRVCACYWALARTPRHSVIAPVDVLTALILQRPQLGGALQQDVGEVLQCFHLAPVTGMELPADGPAVSVDGIVLAQLNMQTLKKDSLTLQALWDCIAVGWKDVSAFPACLVVSFPTVHELPGGGYRYARLALTDVDASIQVGGKIPATYSLRAYVQHRHYGEPSSTSCVAGHYVAHSRMRIFGTRLMILLRRGSVSRGTHCQPRHSSSWYAST